MICSSVNRARFIRPSFVGRTLTPSGGNSQGQVIRAKEAFVTAFKGASDPLTYRDCLHRMQRVG